MTKNTYKGPGGLGLFNRVYVKKGVVGYVVDTEVIPQFKKSEVTQKIKKNPVFTEAIKKPEERLKPIYFSRYFGGNLGRINFTEVISGKNLSSDTMMFGLKFSGPGFLMDEVPLDVDLLFSLAPPDYYDQQVATAPTSGFFAHSSAALRMPLMEWPNTLVFYTLGGMLTYTKFNVVINGQKFDSQEMRIGLTLGGGLAFRVSKKMVLQADIKYYIETTQYLGYLGSLVFEY